VTAEIAWSPAAGEPVLTDEEVDAAVEAALEHGGRGGALLSVVFVDDADLARMHGEWLGDGSPTDVISFDLGEDEPGPVGELYVSAERARAVAAERGLDERRELALYVVHGALHLCGFDDHEPAERERMRAAEAIVLDSLGYAPGPGADDD
jgi:probable rRNA maturation factor